MSYFDNTQGIPGFSPPPTIHAAHTMDVNFTDLKEAPDSIQINFPIEAGGSAGDPNDTQGIDLLMATAINHSNEALTNSQTNTRVTRFHTAKLNGFSFSGLGFAQDVINFSELASVNQLRDLVGADVVAGIVESDFVAFPACGAGFAQTVPSVDFSPGAAFNSFAYNLVTEFCAIWDDTFTHELGHNMGANHTQVEMGPTAVTAISNAGYPDAFGWLSGSFKSIMSITSVTTDRVLSYSAPSVVVDGIATGVLDEANNARVIDELSPAMEIFRSNPDLVFVNGFE